jgi:lycopene cyclase domain-containing protein
MTYAVVALAFLALSAAVAALAAASARPGRTWWWCTAGTLVVLLALTAVFDSLMIAADLFRFDESELLGVHVLRAPVEDFAWPVAATLLLPSLWLLLGPRHARPVEGT